MTRIFVSIVEQELDAAIAAIRAIDDPRLGIEVRVDAFDPAAERDFAPAVLRRASRLPMIYTRRSGDGRPGPSPDEVRRALDAGFDLVDVELGSAVDVTELDTARDRILLSHHDYERVPDIAELIDRMSTTGIANLKIAVTPRSFDQDLELLRMLASYEGGKRLSLFGMGSNGLYSRTIAPFLGSSISFVAIDSLRAAAPGQITVDRALESWVDPADLPNIGPTAFFAVVGRPVRHSQSPRIHNARFRSAGLRAVYGMIEPESIEPVLDAMAESAPFAPLGISVTAPFKTELIDGARARGWEITDRAGRAGSANTAVRIDGGILVDNTDVLGFENAMQSRESGLRVAILGAGGTARAAAVAAIDRDHAVTIFNRTIANAEAIAREIGGSARALDDRGTERFDVVIDTLPASAAGDYEIPATVAGALLVRAGYETVATGGQQGPADAAEIFGPMQLLEAQAEEQSRLFVLAAGENR